MKRPSFGIIAPEKRIMAIDEIRRGDEQEEDGTDEVIRQDPFVVLLGLQEAHAEEIEESGDIDHSDEKQLLIETSFILFGRGVGHVSHKQIGIDSYHVKDIVDVVDRPVIMHNKQ